MKSDHIVTILGAGASRVFGFPVQDQIWDFLRGFCESKYEEQELSGAKIFLGDDIEHAFTLIELSNQTLNSSGSINPHHNTHEYCLFSYLKYKLYRAFTGHELSTTGVTIFKRLIATLRAVDQFPTFISLNWDTSLERILTSKEIRYSHHVVFDNVPHEDRRETISLLKLHGSMNWVYCRFCSGLFLRQNPLEHQVTEHQVTKARSQRHLTLFQQEIEDRMRKGLKRRQPSEEHARDYHAGISYEFLCPSCGMDSAQVVIVPPSMPKNIAGWSNSDWRTAHRQARNATILILIGYSMRDADVDVRMMLESSLRLSSNKLRKILVYDTPEVAHRISKIVSRFDPSRRLEVVTMGYLSMESVHQLRSHIY